MNYLALVGFSSWTSMPGTIKFASMLVKNSRLHSALIKDILSSK
jgi:hypothetical protein